MAQTRGTESKVTSVSPTAALADREIVQERVFDAPRQLVWAAWTDPKHIDKWWGPNGFRNETLSMDLRVGGEWRFLMHGPDGKAWKNWIRFREIKATERLVWDHGGESDEPQFHVTTTFTEQAGRTKVTMRSLFPSAEACATVKKFGAVEGGQQTFARLSGLLPHLLDGTASGSMVLSRVFNAPAKLVFEAWSTQAGLMSWWGPTHFTLPTCEIDFRPGGAYRMVMRDPSGQDYPFHGHYREIVPGQRIVFDATLAPGVELVTTVTFVEDSGKTLLTVCQTVPSMEQAAKGQREGWNGSFEKLAVALDGGAPAETFASLSGR